MVQREGRIIRQGNLNKEVFIYRYVTEASFDSYTWQILENKQKFIAQFLSGTLSAVHRDETDTADTVLNYAEIKALAIGNPLIRKRVDISNRLEHARINQRQKQKQLIKQREWLEVVPARLHTRKNRIAAMWDDQRYYLANKHSVANDDRILFGEKLLDALAHNKYTVRERIFGSYQGFDVILPLKMSPEKPYVLLRRGRGNSYEVKMDDAKALGCSKRIDNVLDHLGQEIERNQKEYEQLESQKNTAEAEALQGNEFDDEVARLAEELSNIDAILKEDVAV